MTTPNVKAALEVFRRARAKMADYAPMMWAEDIEAMDAALSALSALAAAPEVERVRRDLRAVRAEIERYLSAKLARLDATATLAPESAAPSGEAETVANCDRCDKPGCVIAGGIITPICDDCYGIMEKVAPAPTPEATQAPTREAEGCAGRHDKFHPECRDCAVAAVEGFDRLRAALAAKGAELAKVREEHEALSKDYGNLVREHGEEVGALRKRLEEAEKERDAFMRNAGRAAARQSDAEARAAAAEKSAERNAASGKTGGGSET